MARKATAQVQAPVSDNVVSMVDEKAKRQAMNITVGEIVIDAPPPPAITRTREGANGFRKVLMEMPAGSYVGLEASSTAEMNGLRAAITLINKKLVGAKLVTRKDGDSKLGVWKVAT